MERFHYSTEIYADIGQNNKFTHFQREVEEGLHSAYAGGSSPFSYNSWERRSSLSGGSRERQVIMEKLMILIVAVLVSVFVEMTM